MEQIYIKIEVNAFMIYGPMFHTHLYLFGCNIGGWCVMMSEVFILQRSEG